jgi:tRNA G18 (ribose-2'-O)-methylase SpoU
MNKECESLNAGVSASIIMYEVNNKWNTFLLVK